jgi:hypothetical protein
MSTKHDCYFTIILMLIMMFIVPHTVTAQDDDTNSTPVTISLGTVRTELEQVAFQYAIKYSKEFSGEDVLVALNGSAFYLTPEINLQGGEQDSFNSVIAKFTGSLLLFSTTDVVGIKTPNTAFFHAIPFSTGIETSNRFDTVNFLGEIGYTPWFQGSVPKFWKTLHVGAFVQGGYKAKMDDPPVDIDANRGGSADESSEKAESGLLRVKGKGIFSPEFTIDEKTDVGLGVEVTGAVWCDLLNSDVYEMIEATFRLILANDKSFDFSYQKGSGAPNFNRGDQFGAGLTIEF